MSDERNMDLYVLTKGVHIVARSVTKIAAILDAEGEGKWTDIKYIGHCPLGLLYFNRITGTLWVVSEED